MGYHVQLYGQLAFSRPLTLLEIKTLEPMLEHFRLETEVKEEEDDEGVYARTTATSLEVKEIDERRDNGIADELQRVLDALPLDLAAAGEFRIEGDENTDISRLVLDAGRAKTLRPKLVWPDGKKEDL